MSYLFYPHTHTRQPSKIDYLQKRYDSGTRRLAGTISEVILAFCTIHSAETSRDRCNLTYSGCSISFPPPFFPLFFLLVLPAFLFHREHLNYKAETPRPPPLMHGFNVTGLYIRPPRRSPETSTPLHTCVCL